MKREVEVKSVKVLKQLNRDVTFGASCKTRVFLLRYHVLYDGFYSFNYVGMNFAENLKA